MEYKKSLRLLTGAFFLVVPGGGEKETYLVSFKIERMYNYYSNNAYTHFDK